MTELESAGPLRNLVNEGRVGWRENWRGIIIALPHQNFSNSKPNTRTTSRDKRHLPLENVRTEKVIIVIKASNVALQHRFRHLGITLRPRELQGGSSGRRAMHVWYSREHGDSTEFWWGRVIVNLTFVTFFSLTFEAFSVWKFSSIL